MKNKHYKVERVKERELEDFLNDSYREGYELKLMESLGFGPPYLFSVVLEKVLLDMCVDI